MRLSQQALLRIGFAITGIHALATLLSLLLGPTVQNALVAVFGVLFFGGALGCLVAFLVAIGRSRYEQVHLAGAFFLADKVIEPKTRKMAYLMLLAQTLIGVVAASLAPFTPVAFSVLVPLAGMAVVALLGSMCGTFDSKLGVVDGTADKRV